VLKNAVWQRRWSPALVLQTSSGRPCVPSYGFRQIGAASGVLRHIYLTNSVSLAVASGPLSYCVGTKVAPEVIHIVLIVNSLVGLVRRRLERIISMAQYLRLAEAVPW
jgi:hypothetical protein